MILAQTDIGSVPADFVKYFMMMAGFLITGWLAYRKGQQAKGTKEEPLNVAQPLQVQHAPEFADAEDVEELEKGASEISERITQMQQTFLTKLHELGKETLSGMGEIKSMASRHDALIQQMEHRLSSLEKSHSDAVQRLHSRIDDTLKRGAKN